MEVQLRGFLIFSLIVIGHSDAPSSLSRFKIFLAHSLYEGGQIPQPSGSVVIEKTLARYSQLIWPRFDPCTSCKKVYSCTSASTGSVSSNYEHPVYTVCLKTDAVSSIIRLYDKDNRGNELQKKCLSKHKHPCDIRGSRSSVAKQSSLVKWQAVSNEQFPKLCLRLQGQAVPRRNDCHV